MSEAGETDKAIILLRYTKAEPGAECRLELRFNDSRSIFSVINDMGPDAAEKYMIA